MGPCLECGREGRFGAPHPRKRVTLWACGEHRKSLPRPEDYDYEAGEAEDMEAAARWMAVVLSRAGHKDKLAEIGAEAWSQAFAQGVGAYFANRTERLTP